jgi:hypothetical protein
MNLAVRAEAVWERWMRIRLENPGRGMRARLEEGRRLRARATGRLRCGALSGIASGE